MIEIILGCIVLIAIILLIIIIYHNKFQFSIIKMDEAENNIDILLQKKFDLINRSRSIIKKELKIDDFLDNLDNNDLNFNHFEMNNFLKKNYNELFKLLDDNEKLYKNKALVSIIEDINENELELVAAIKFYNDNVVTFNKLIMSFPSNIIRLFFGYKKKDFYNNEKREIFEILKEK